MLKFWAFFEKKIFLTLFDVETLEVKKKTSNVKKNFFFKKRPKF